MKFWDRFTGRVKRRLIGSVLAVALGVAGFSVSPAVTNGAVEFIYILTEGGSEDSAENQTE